MLKQARVRSKRTQFQRTSRRRGLFFEGLESRRVLSIDLQQCLGLDIGVETGDPLNEDGLVSAETCGHSLKASKTELVVAVSAEDPIATFANFLEQQPDHPLREMIKLGDSWAVLPQGDTWIAEIQHTGVETAEELQDLIEWVEAVPGVEWATPNFEYEGDPREFLPDDPLYGSQYHHSLMQNDLAWDITIGDPSVVVAVTDDGVWLDHPDLANNIWTNPGELAGNGIDDDGNGFVDDVNGWDFSSGDNNPNPASPFSQQHGTHVSGIAAGDTDNGVGIAGTAGGATIMPIRFYGSSAWTSTIIAASYRYAVDNGARIINTSYNVDGFVGDPTFLAGLNYLYDHGGLHFNSAGNNNQANPPRQVFEQSLFVASTDQLDRKSGFSNYGTGIDIAAPGTSILSTVPTGGYAYFSGTSMATPNAAGAAALIWSANPDWTREQVAAQLVGTADNIDAQNPAYVGQLGGGRVNSYRALTETLAAPQVRDISGLPAPGADSTDQLLDAFQVSFSQIVDPDTANDIANYELRAAGADGSFDTADDVVYTLFLPDPYRIGTNVLDIDILDTPLELGEHRLTIFAGGIASPFGTPLDGDQDGVGGDDHVQFFNITAPQLVALQPIGSLAYGYERELYGRIPVAAEADTVSLLLDPGQKISVKVDGSAMLRPSVSIFNHDGELVGSATAGAAGEVAFLQSVATHGQLDQRGPHAQRYDVVVSGADDSTGSYALEVFLNAAIEDEQATGSVNDTLETATDLGPAFVPLHGSVEDTESGRPEIAVLSGSIGGILAQEDFESGSIPSSFATSSSQFQGRIRVAPPVGTGNSSSYSLLMDREPSGSFNLNEAIYTVDLTGVTAANLSFSHMEFGDENHFLPLNYVGSRAGDGVSISDDGINWRTILNSPQSSPDGDWESFSIDLAAAASAAGMTLGPDFQIKFQQFDDFPFFSDGRGYDDIVISTQDDDWFRFDLEAGESATVALTAQNGGTVDLALFDDGGVPVALGGGDSENVSEVISNFVATTAGPYYARVRGDLGAEYRLVVTRNADFDTEANDDISSARPLLSASAAGRQWVSGAITERDIAIEAFETGWYRSDSGFHNPGSINYFTGLAGGALELRSFFGFDLADVTGTVNSARLDVFSHLVQTSDPFETLQISEVTTPLADVFAGGAGRFDIFDDLGTGTNFGSLDVQSSESDTLLTVELNREAIAALNATRGQSIALGGSLSTIEPNGQRQAIFSASFAGPPQQLVLSLADSDFYEITADGNSQLIIETRTPGTKEGAFANDLDPVVRLYDSTGNLVASDDNGDPDRRNARLRYKVPTTAGGTYYVEVTASPGTDQPTNGEYVLAVSHAAGELPPFLITAANLTEGSRLRGPTTQITVDFNDSVLLTSLEPTDLTVNGVAATGYAVVDANTVTFDLPALSEGEQEVVIAAGAVLDLQNTPVVVFSTTFYEDLTPPRVVDVSVQQGEIVAMSGLTEDFTYRVTFSEPMRTADLDVSDVRLRGVNRAADYTPSSVSYDATGTVLTIDFEDLPEDRYTLTLLSGNGRFEDSASPDGWNLDGEPLAFPIPPNESGDGNEGGNFFVTFDLDITTAAYPTPLDAKLPPGSLIYDPSVAATISPSGDTDNYTIDLDAGQTITVLADPSASLQPSIELWDSSNVLVGSASAVAAGQDALLQTVATVAGTYTMVVGGLAGTTGGMNLQVTLNAALEEESHDGATNDTLATAQDINGSFVELLKGATRGAVLGTIDSGPPAPPVNEVEPNNTLATSQSLDGEVFTLAFDPNIAQSTTIPHVTVLGTGDNTFDYYSFTVDNAGDVGIFDIDFGTTGGVDSYLTLYNSNGSFLASNDDSSTSSGGGGSTSSLDSFIQYTFGAPGTYVIEVGSCCVGTVPSNATYTLQVSLTGKSAPSTTPDIYSFDVADNEQITLAATAQGGGNVNLELLDAGGTLLATGSAAQTNVDQMIYNHGPLASGTYYARLSGDDGTPYSLVVTRDAVFDREGNDTFATAQNFDGVVGSLGYISLNEISGIVAEVEPNNNLADAQNLDAEAWSLAEDPNIAQSTTIPHVTVLGTGDNTFDYYSFTVDNAGDVGIFDIDFGTTGGVDSYLRLYNSNGSFLASNDDSSTSSGGGGSTSGLDSFIQYTFGAPGTYVIEVGRCCVGPVPSGSTYTLQVSIQNHATATGGPEDDWYSVNLTAGVTEYFFTTTPGDGPGEFVNTLDPKIELYDPSGALIVSGTPLADGRNEEFTFTPTTTGLYRIRVTGEGGTSGEYFLDPIELPTAGNEGAGNASTQVATRGIVAFLPDGGEDRGRPAESTARLHWDTDITQRVPAPLTGTTTGVASMIQPQHARATAYGTPGAIFVDVNSANTGSQRASLLDQVLADYDEFDAEPRTVVDREARVLDRRHVGTRNHATSGEDSRNTRSRSDAPEFGDLSRELPLPAKLRDDFFAELAEQDRIETYGQAAPIGAVGAALVALTSIHGRDPEAEQDRKLRRRR